MKSGKINIEERAKGFNDSHEARELELFIMNTYEVYARHYVPMVKMLARRVKRGDYDRARALVACERVVYHAAREYMRTYCGSNENIRDIFPVGVRCAVALELERYAADYIEEGGAA